MPGAVCVVSISLQFGVLTRDTSPPGSTAPALRNVSFTASKAALGTGFAVAWAAVIAAVRAASARECAPDRCGRPRRGIGGHGVDRAVVLDGDPAGGDGFAHGALAAAPVRRVCPP